MDDRIIEMNVLFLYYWQIMNQYEKLHIWVSPLVITVLSFVFPLDNEYFVNISFIRVFLAFICNSGMVFIPPLPPNHSHIMSLFEKYTIGRDIFRKYKPTPNKTRLQDLL